MIDEFVGEAPTVVVVTNVPEVVNPVFIAVDAIIEVGVPIVIVDVGAAPVMVMTPLSF